MSLEDIIKNNQYPIVFIGAGISKRYLKDFPSWDELLKEFWAEIRDDDFYKHLMKIRTEIQQSSSKLSDDDLSFKVNTQLADEIQQAYDTAYYDQTIELEDVDSEYFYKNNISPFKYAIAKKYKTYNFRDDLNIDEFNSFKSVLEKAKIIVTTNYDCFIEDTLKELSHEPKVFIGQEGFFTETIGWSELFKIHGSVSEPSSIVLNSNDYKKYDKNSILISAKIISTMVNSPILFLGYSLTDRNIVNLLSDFSSQLPKSDDSEIYNKIILVEYDPGNLEISETIQSNSTGKIGYTHLKTDNYKLIFDKISNIDEGLTPFEIMKYNDAIRNLIVTSGTQGALRSVLIAPTDLDNIIDDINQNKPVVVAMGDTKTIFVNPTPTYYINDYVSKKFEIMPENALRFLALEQNNSRYPFIRHYNKIEFEKSNLEPFEIIRLKKKMTDLGENGPDINKIKDTIPNKFQIVYTSISEIIKENIKLVDQINLIIYNCDHLEQKSLDNYVQDMALPNFITMYKKHNKTNSMEKSVYRKLFLAWDIVNYAK